MWDDANRRLSNFFSFLSAISGLYRQCIRVSKSYLCSKIQFYDPISELLPCHWESAVLSSSNIMCHESTQRVTQFSGRAETNGGRRGAICRRSQTQTHCTQAPFPSQSQLPLFRPHVPSGAFSRIYANKENNCDYRRRQSCRCGTAKECKQYIIITRGEFTTVWSLCRIRVLSHILLLQIHSLVSLLTLHTSFSFLLKCLEGCQLERWKAAAH